MEDGATDVSGSSDASGALRNPMVEALFSGGIGGLSPSVVDALLDATAEEGAAPELVTRAIEELCDLLHHGETDPDACLLHPQDELRRLLSRSPAGARYELLGEVGEGGMGTVVKSRDHRMRRDVAVKYAKDLLVPRLPCRWLPSAQDVTRLARFLREVHILARITHPNIVHVYDYGLDPDGRAYCAMQFVDGRPLSEVIRDCRQHVDGWTLEAGVRLIASVADAVAFAHELGILHRDLKPQNILVDRSRKPIVVDWGLGKTRSVFASRRCSERGGAVDRGEDARASARSMFETQAGPLPRSPHYAAPEQLRGEFAGIDTDIYLLGATLYELLTGFAPRCEPRRDEPIPLHSLRLRVPVEWVAICECAMSNAREDRYPSMSAFAADLRSCLEGRSVAAHRVGPIGELRKWAQRNRTVAVGIAIAAAAGGFGLYMWDRKHVQARELSITESALAVSDAAYQLSAGYPSAAFDALATEPRRERTAEASFLLGLCTPRGGAARLDAELGSPEALLVGRRTQRLYFGTSEGCVGSFELPLAHDATHSALWRHTSPVVALDEADADGEFVLAVCEDGAVACLAAADCRERWCLQATQAPPGDERAHAAAFDPAAARVFLGTTHGRVIECSWTSADLAPAPRVVARLSCESACSIDAIAVAPRGDRVALQTDAPRLFIATIADGSVVELPHPASLPRACEWFQASVQYSPDGRWLAYTLPGCVVVRALEQDGIPLISGSAVRALPMETRARLCFRGDSARLCVASERGTIREYELASAGAHGEWLPSKQVDAHDTSVRALADASAHPSPLGVLSGGADRWIKVWPTFEAASPRKWTEAGVGAAASALDSVHDLTTARRGRAVAWIGGRSRKQRAAWFKLDDRAAAQRIGETSAVDTSATPRSIALDAGAERVAVGTEDGCIREYETANLRSCVLEAGVTRGAVAGLCYDAGSRSLLANVEINVVLNQAWLRTSSGELTKLDWIPRHRARPVASPVGRGFALAGLSTVAILDGDGRVSRSLGRKDAAGAADACVPAGPVCFDESGERLATAWEDNHIVVFDVDGEREIVLARKGSRATSRHTGLVFVPGQDRLIAADVDGSLAFHALSETPARLRWNACPGTRIGGSALRAAQSGEAPLALITWSALDSPREWAFGD